MEKALRDNLYKLKRDLSFAPGEWRVDDFKKVKKIVDLLTPSGKAELLKVIKNAGGRMTSDKVGDWEESIDDEQAILREKLLKFRDDKTEVERGADVFIPEPDPKVYEKVEIGSGLQGYLNWWFLINNHRDTLGESKFYQEITAALTKLYQIDQDFESDLIVVRFEDGKDGSPGFEKVRRNFKGELSTPFIKSIGNIGWINRLYQPNPRERWSRRELFSEGYIFHHLAVYVKKLPEVKKVPAESWSILGGKKFKANNLTVQNCIIGSWEDYFNKINFFFKDALI